MQTSSSYLRLCSCWFHCFRPCDYRWVRGINVQKCTRSIVREQFENAGSRFVVRVADRPMSLFSSEARWNGLNMLIKDPMQSRKERQRKICAGQWTGREYKCREETKGASGDLNRGATERCQLYTEKAHVRVSPPARFRATWTSRPPSFQQRCKSQPHECGMPSLALPRCAFESGEKLTLD